VLKLFWLVEPYLDDYMSKENRTQIQAIICPLQNVPVIIYLLSKA